MSEEQEMNLTQQERAFEAKLAGLRPRAGGVSAQAAVVEAGLRKARRQVWIWRIAAGVMMAMLPAVYLHRPEVIKETIVPQSPVVVEEKPAEIRIEPTPLMMPVKLTGESYIAIRNRVIMTGSIDKPLRKTGDAGPSVTKPLEGSTAWELRRKMEGL